MAAARVDGRVVVFLEPIALYMTKDLLEPKDGGWSFPYPEPTSYIPMGEGHVYDESAKDLTILTFANGVHMSLRAADRLKKEHGIAVRVVDLRWLQPLNAEFIVEQASASKATLIVDESRKSGGLSEPIMTILCERLGAGQRLARLTGHDSFIPLGAAANCVLPTEDDIVREALQVTST